MSVLGNSTPLLEKSGGSQDTNEPKISVASNNTLSTISPNSSADPSVPSSSLSGSSESFRASTSQEAHWIPNSQITNGAVDGSFDRLSLRSSERTASMDNFKKIKDTMSEFPVIYANAALSSRFAKGSCAMGFPMPFYVSESGTALPIALKLDETAIPIEGMIFYEALRCFVPVGIEPSKEEVEHLLACLSAETRAKIENGQTHQLKFVKRTDGSICLGVIADPAMTINGHPLPHYLLSDGRLYQMLYSEDGAPYEGYVGWRNNGADHKRDTMTPISGETDCQTVAVPIGLQYVSREGEIIGGYVLTMESRIVRGRPVHHDGWSLPYISKYKELFDAAAMKSQDDLREACKIGQILAEEKKRKEALNDDKFVVQEDKITFGNCIDRRSLGDRLEDDVEVSPGAPGSSEDVNMDSGTDIEAQYSPKNLAERLPLPTSMFTSSETCSSSGHIPLPTVVNRYLASAACERDTVPQPTDMKGFDSLPLREKSFGASQQPTPRPSRSPARIKSPNMASMPSARLTSSGPPEILGMAQNYSAELSHGTDKSRDSKQSRVHFGSNVAVVQSESLDSNMVEEDKTTSREGATGRLYKQIIENEIIRQNSLPNSVRGPDTCSSVVSTERKADITRSNTQLPGTQIASFSNQESHSAQIDFGWNKIDKSTNSVAACAKFGGMDGYQQLASDGHNRVHEAPNSNSLKSNLSPSNYSGMPLEHNKHSTVIDQNATRETTEFGNTRSQNVLANYSVGSREWEPIPDHSQITNYSKVKDRCVLREINQPEETELSKPIRLVSGACVKRPFDEINTEGSTETYTCKSQQQGDSTLVEVPYIEERVTYVPKKETVVLETRVPKVMIQEVEKLVEVPEVRIIDREVEVPFIEQRIITKAKKEIIDVPKEVTIQVPKVIVKQVEKQQLVPGEVIEIPTKYTVPQEVLIKRFKDNEVPTVVAQTTRPVLKVSANDISASCRMVECVKYEPVLVPVDVYVPRIERNNLEIRQIKRSQAPVPTDEIPAGQWNFLVKRLNPHLMMPDGKLSIDLPILRDTGSGQSNPLFTSRSVLGIPLLGAVEQQSTQLSGSHPASAPGGFREMRFGTEYPPSSPSKLSSSNVLRTTAGEREPSMSNPIGGDNMFTKSLRQRDAGNCLMNEKETSKGPNFGSFSSFVSSLNYGGQRETVPSRSTIGVTGYWADKLKTTSFGGDTNRSQLTTSEGNGFFRQEDTSSCVSSLRMDSSQGGTQDDGVVMTRGGKQRLSVKQRAEVSETSADPHSCCSTSRTANLLPTSTCGLPSSWFCGSTPNRRLRSRSCPIKAGRTKLLKSSRRKTSTPNSRGEMLFNPYVSSMARTANMYRQ